ncbi:hypothetical protein FSP39_024126 [Pinctada imbricata]|uniref:Uncharacterized protein n=1 Tax=Pinctada imbricata TaxID=66713 RepID=A0AA88YRI5_PINIB|nr:hypothetical protein FSP39_024126 [Pinctada imbricata]
MSGPYEAVNTEEISPIPNSLKVRMRSQTDIKRDALKILRISQLLHMKVILVCSPRDQEQNLIHIMLEAAKEFHILDDDQNKLVLLDTAFFYEPLRELNMYRHGLYSARAEILAYRYTDEYSGYWDLTSAWEATAVDAVEVIKQAKRTYLDAVPPQSEQHYSLNLSNFLMALRSSSLSNGRTGQVMFDAKGNRKNFTLHLYRHGGNMELYNKEGMWSSVGTSFNDRLRLVETNDTSQQQSRGIFEGVVKVVVVVEEPFVILDKDRSGNDRFDGFTIDLLKALAEKLQMTYEIYQSPGNMYGAEANNGRWDGIVGEVVSGNATLGMGAISITSTREKVIDFSLGVITSGTNMLISKPKPKETELFQFMKPFSLPLWMAIVGASAVLSLLYFVMDYSNEERLFTVRETLWFSIGTLLMRGTDFSPRRTSQRILTAGFTFFVLITVSTYTANLAAFLTRRSLEVPINSLEELAETSNFQVGTVRNSATMSFFKNGDKNIYRTIWERVVDSDGLVSSSKEGKERSANGNFAFIFDYLINNYAEYTDCDTKMVGIPFRLQEHGIAMRQGASFKTRLNIALLQLKEAGKLAALKTKWWDNKRQCDLEAEKDQDPNFTLNLMAGVFIVGGFGLACSVAFFLFKKFYLLTKITAVKSNQKDKISIDEKKKSPSSDIPVDV